MTLLPDDAVHGLIELSKTLPNGEEFLRAIRDGLSRQIGKEESILHVTIETPSGDAGALRGAAEELLRKKFGNRPIEFHERSRKDLIGGAVITFGDEQIDLSVRGALTQAASAITGTPSSL